MKKLFVIFLFAVISFTAGAQKLVTLTADTVQGNETIYIASDEISDSWDHVTIQVLCTETGGTADGTVTLQGSVDGTNYVPLTDYSGIVKGYPNDSLTIADGAVTSWVINGVPYNYYRLKIAGTASDSTLISPKVALNRK